MKFCGECGSELLEGVKFCNNCGTKVQRLVKDEQHPPKSEIEAAKTDKAPENLTAISELPISAPATPLAVPPAVKSEPVVRKSNPAILTSKPKPLNSQTTVNEDRLAPSVLGGMRDEEPRSKTPLILTGIGLPLVLAAGGFIWWMSQPTLAVKPKVASTQTSAAAKAPAENIVDLQALKLEFDSKTGLSTKSVTQLEKVSAENSDAAHLLGQHFHKKGKWEKSNSYLTKAKTAGVTRLDPMIGENYRRLFLVSNSTDTLRKANASFAAAKGYDPNSACKHTLLNTNISKVKVTEMISEYESNADGEVIAFYGPLLQQYYGKSTGARLGTAEVSENDAFEKMMRAGLTDTGLCRNALILQLLVGIESDVTDYVEFDLDNFDPNEIYSTLDDGYLDEASIEALRMSSEDYQVDFFIKAKNLAIGSARNGDAMAIPVVMAGYEAEYAKKMVDEKMKLSKFEGMDEDDLEDDVEVLVEVLSLVPDMLKNMKKLTEDAEYKMTFWNNKCKAVGNEDLTEGCSEILEYSQSTGVLSWYQDILDEF